MKTLEQFINEFYNGLISDTRTSTGESFIKLKDDLENREVYQDIIRECHEGLLPNDSIYDCIDSLLGNMIELDLVDCNDLRDLEINEDFEVSDFRNHPHVTSYYDQALQEAPKTFSQLEQSAELAFIREVKNNLISAISDLEGLEWDFAENLED